MSAVADMCVDLVVIGGGPGGYTAALRGAQAGLKTILINGDELGGCCLNYGCIPSKAFIHSAKLYRQIESSKQFGVMVDGVSLDFSRVQTWKNRVMRRLQRGLQTLLDGVGVQIVNGTATLTGAETLSVNESQGGLVKIMFAHAVIAVGSRPRRLTDFKNSAASVVDTDSAFSIDQVPEDVIVVGGGAAGLEWAWLMNAFGARVTVIETMPRIASYLDIDISEGLRNSLIKQGIRVVIDATVEFVEEKNGRAKVSVGVGEGEAELLVADLIIGAVGRKAATQGLGLEMVAVKVDDDGGIIVKDDMSTSVAHIYAVGDCVSGSGLAHQAMAQAEVAVAGIRGEVTDTSSLIVPTCIFTQPEAVCVGLTEEEAQSQGMSVVEGRFPFRASGRAAISDETDGFVKLIANEEDGRLVGVHILSSVASELVGEATLALRSNMTLNQYARVVRQHPTFTEALGEAAWDALGHPLHIPGSSTLPH